MFKNFIRMFSYFIGFVLLAAAAFFLVYKLLNFNKVAMPSLTGKSIFEAQELLQPGGLSLVVEGEEYDTDIPKDHILKQDIPAGEKVKSGSEIKVITSKGVEMFSMPSFEGQVFEEAKLTLLNLGMNVGKVTSVHSDSVEEGVIIAQRPLPGNVQSSKVNFLVSLGPYDVSYLCPSFVKMTVDDARALAATLGIKLVEQEEGNVVIFQKPEAGATIQRDDSIEVTLGRRGGVWF
ncbi:MAG: PASTA domain-containing protein [Thermodesulfovibrionia bacterium]|nr:PASTA domain-containing protein [Thermodesulfovibrionia bacterium]